MNPRAAINDLLPFQGSPFSLLGTSPNKLTYKRYLISIQADTAEKVGFEPTAPCGVTGFQDQLLKPLGHLSIALFLSWKVSRDNRYIIISKAKCQQLILLFFKKNYNNYKLSKKASAITRSSGVVILILR